MLLVLSTHPRHDLSYFYEAMSSSFVCFNRMRLFKRRCSDPSPQLVSLSPICQDVINDIILDDTSVRTRHDPRPPPVPGSSRRTSACEESPKTNMKGEGHCQCCSHATGRQRVRAACVNKGRSPRVPDCLRSFDNASCPTIIICVIVCMYVRMYVCVYVCR